MRSRLRKHTVIWQRAAERHSGLTLLETLITLALTGFILAGISGGIRQFWRYRTLAMDNSHTAAVWRGIAEDLSVDLRAARSPLKRREAPEEINRTALPLTDGDDNSIRERVLDLSESRLNLERAVGSHPVSLVGERDWLALLLRGTSFRFPDLAASASGLKHVVWWDGRSIRPGLTLSGARTVPVALGGDGIQRGLYRASVPFHPFTDPGRSDGVQIHEVSRQVLRLSFRYFDGGGWTSRWNSEERKRLPAAVECEFSGSSDQDSETLVIRLPAGAI
ncbi:MAG: hypothetical protein ACKO2L_07980 [Planctomycetaceae bacterium]